MLQPHSLTDVLQIELQRFGSDLEFCNGYLTVHSQLRFISRELLREPFAVADLGGARNAPVSKFFHFHAVFGQKNRLTHPLLELAPPHLRKNLDPRK